VIDGSHGVREEAMSGIRRLERLIFVTSASKSASRSGPHATAERTPGDADCQVLLARGDRRAAVAAMIDAHGEAVFDFCARVLRNRTLAEDVLQRVFLDAYRGIDRFAGRSSLRSWLIGIAGHRCYDALRAQRRAQQRLEPGLQLVHDVADPGSTPVERLEHRRLAAALGDCLKVMSDEVRMTVLLRFQHGKSYDEMAEALATNVNTLHARVSRALPVLKRCLEAKGWGRD